MSYPSPPSHPKDDLRSMRQSKYWQKTALLCHTCFRQLPRLHCLSTSTHQNYTLWWSMLMGNGLEKTIPKMHHLPQPKSLLGSPQCGNVPAAPQETSWSSFLFTLFQFSKFHHQKTLNFQGKTFLEVGWAVGQMGLYKWLHYCCFDLIKWKCI